MKTSLVQTAVFSTLVVLLSLRTPAPAQTVGKLIQLSTIGTGQDHPILGAFGITFLTGDKFLVADKLEYDVKCFDRSGHWLSSFGGRGNADGQFRAPGPISADGSQIAVADLASIRVQLFSSDFVHAATFYTEKPVFDLKFDRRGHLWVGQLPGKHGEMLLEYDRAGRLLRGFVTNRPSDNEFENIFTMAMRADGKLILAYLCRNVIEIWDTSGRCESTLSVPGLPAKSHQTKISQGLFAADISVPEENIFRSVASDRKGLIYLLVAAYTGLPERDVYVLDQQGMLISQLVLLQPSKGIAITSGNELYSFEEERTMIRIYRIPAR